MGHLLQRLRPASPRSAAICATTAADLHQPNVALAFAQMGLALAHPGGPAQHDEPYHRALLHLVAARAVVQGGAGGPSYLAAAVQAHVQGAKAAQAACREWLPTALKQALKQAQLFVPLFDAQLAAATQVRFSAAPARRLPASGAHTPPPSCRLLQARSTTLPVEPPPPPVGVLVGAGIPPPAPRQGSGQCDCPVCRAQAKKCSGCGNVVSELRKCSGCRQVAYCSVACQSGCGDEELEGGRGWQGEGSPTPSSSWQLAPDAALVLATLCREPLASGAQARMR